MHIWFPDSARGRVGEEDLEVKMDKMRRKALLREPRKLRDIMIQNVKIGNALFGYSETRSSASVSFEPYIKMGESRKLPIKMWQYHSRAVIKFEILSAVLVDAKAFSGFEQC